MAIVYIKGNAYRIYFWYTSKDDAINVMIKVFLFYLIKQVFYNLFLLYKKMSEDTNLTYYQKTRNMILNRSKDYYENNKERLRLKARDKYKYKDLSEEEKNKQREYGKNRRRNMSEEEKKRLKECQKKYHEVRRSKCIINKWFF